MESSGSLNDDITNANLEQPLFPNKYNKLLFICIGKEDGGKKARKSLAKLEL